MVEDGSLTPGFKLSGLINSLCAWSTVVEVLDDGHYKTNMCFRNICVERNHNLQVHTRPSMAIYHNFDQSVQQVRKVLASTKWRFKNVNSRSPGSSGLRRDWR